MEAHGTFFTSHCTRTLCKKSYSLDWMKGEEAWEAKITESLGGGQCKRKRPFPEEACLNLEGLPVMLRRGEERWGRLWWATPQ